jgi:large repetitive protein
MKTMLLVWVYSILASGCFEAPKVSCPFACGANDACPSSYACGSDKACHLIEGGKPLACVGPVDARIDAGPGAAPMVTAQKTLALDEDEALLLRVTDFTIIDADSTTFTLTVQDGTNYTHTGNSVSPAVNFNGALSVALSVSDGSHDSAPFTAALTVRPINDTPVITAQLPLTTAAATPLPITVADFTITDPDNVTADFTLTVMDGNDYTRAGNTITPTGAGPLTVPVTVSDGAATSAIFNATVTVM